MREMMRKSSFLMRTMVVTVVLSVTVGAADVALAGDPARDFMVSCSYGVLAGTLVGGATLAFSDMPGDNLNKVARGASLGLYAGILLGLYVIYGGPANEEDDGAAAAAAQLGASAPLEHRRQSQMAQTMPSFVVAPILGGHGLEGAQAQAQVFSF